MFKNYLKIALRNLIRYKGYSFINITGLALGMACCMLILLWVKDELNYDRYHDDADRIYRVALELQTRDSRRLTAVTQCQIGPILKQELPQVEQSVRFLRWGSWLVKYGEKKVFYENLFYYVDPEVFDLFKIPFIQGNPNTALTRLSTVVITRDMARKYFENQNPMGKILNINNEDYEVTGVIENIPHYTHLKFDFLASVKVLEDRRPFIYWGTLAFYTYIKVGRNASIDQLVSQLKQFQDKYMPEPPSDIKVPTYNYFLQPLKEIHLFSHLQNETEVPGNLLYIYMFSAIAIFVLIIACINFVSLATAQSANRAREVGLRKVVGAHRSQLMKQFLGESVILSGIALGCALVIAEIVLPMFNSLTGRWIDFDIFNDIGLFLMIFGIFVLVGIVSGSYPAFFLSSFRPALIIKGELAAGSRGAVLRKVLVFSQFTISIILIAGSLIVQKQLDFMKARDLGFNKDRVLVLPTRGSRAIKENYESIKNEFQQHPAVVSASVSSSVPGRPLTTLETRLDSVENDRSQVMLHLFVDHDFINLYKIDIIAGRGFKKELTSDEGDVFLINEAAVKALGWNSPKEALGKPLFVSGLFKPQGRVIGVTKDFHYRSLHRTVEPVVFKIVPIRYRNISLKIKMDQVSEALTFIETKWKALFPGKPFDYFFLDQEFNKQYQWSEKFARIFGIFTMLAIVIACLGLFGLASFTTQQRTKEIGIRKVLGASVSRIFLLLSREFVQYVVLANLAAWPIGYYIMSKWLQSFAYRTTLETEIFILSGLIALIIALVTVSYQSIKASKANPVEALRYE